MLSAQICFLGAGVMAKNIISGLIKEDDNNRKFITIFDHNQNKTTEVSNLFQIKVSQSIRDIIEKSEVIMLCVKPQSLKNLVGSIRPVLDEQKEPLFISIVAGISIIQISNWLGSKCPIIRVMPNVPSCIGYGASALMASLNTPPCKIQIAEEIIRKIGVITWVKNESLIDIVTAISGSGPAYFFLMMRHMIDTAISLGLSRKQANLLVKQTAFGSSKMAIDSDQSLEVLLSNVNSRNGVTAAALKSFLDTGFKENISRAIKKNVLRSKEISKEFEELS